MSITTRLPISILRANEWDVWRFLDQCGVLRRVVIRSGWFKTTLSQLSAEQKFCFIHIDCDVYASASTCLQRLYDRVVPGGVVVFDDYFDLGGGEKKAVDEFMEDKNELLFAGPIEQVFFFKGRSRTERDEEFLMDPFDDGGSLVSIEHLIGDSQYLRDLRENVRLPELPAREMQAAAALARQILRVVGYHDRVLERAGVRAGVERDS